MATTAVTAPARSALHSARSPLALWHLLSLDAPCVAALWVVFTARCFRVHLPMTVPLALGVAVWMLYAADRLADAAFGEGQLQERHHFHQRYALPFAGALLGSMPVLFLLVWLLPAPLRMAWLLLAIPMALYAVVVHALRLPRLPKEHLVGIFFAVAVAIPVLVAHDVSRYGIAAAAIAFGAVCWLNCTAIARWERSDAAQTDPGTAWAVRHFGPAACVLALLCAVLPIVRGGHILFAAACSAATLLLLLLDGSRRSLRSIALRSLADAALLTPLLLWPLLPR